MLFTCCLLHITVIVLKHILYLVHLCPCFDLFLFMSYTCDRFFIFSLIFIIINHIISIRQTHLFFAHFLEYRKILSIRPGRIYEQRTNLMGLYSRGLYTAGGGLILRRKNTSICNLLNLLLIFLFSRFCNNQLPQMVRITFHPRRIYRQRNKFDGPIFGEAYIQEGLYSGC